MCSGNHTAVVNKDPVYLSVLLVCLWQTAQLFVQKKNNNNQAPFTSRERLNIWMEDQSDTPTPVKVPPGLHKHATQ